MRSKFCVILWFLCVTFIWQKYWIGAPKTRAKITIFQTPVFQLFISLLYRRTKGHNASRPLRLCVNIKYALMLFCQKKLLASTVSFPCFCVQNLNERDTFLSGVIFCNIRKNYWFRQVWCMEKCSVSSVHKYFRWSFTECYIKNEYLCKVIVIGLYTLLFVTFKEPTRVLKPSQPHTSRPHNLKTSQPQTLWSSSE